MRGWGWWVDGLLWCSLGGVLVKGTLGGLSHWVVACEVGDCFYAIFWFCLGLVLYAEFFVTSV